MCTYCGQQCVEDESFRGKKDVPENICPDKIIRVTNNQPLDINDILFSWDIDELIDELDNNNL